MRRAGIALVTGLLFLAASCTNDDGQTQGASARLRATDPKTITLQLGDLPSGSEEGDLIEVTPQNLDTIHRDKKIDDGQHSQLSKVDFKGMASRSFIYGEDGSVVSIVIIFDDLADADSYYNEGFPPPPSGVTARKISDAPRFGDRSLSQFMNSPGEISPGQEVVSGQTIRTRCQIRNAVIEVIVSEDVSELDQDEVFSITRKAVARVR